ncbi:hypothetical protein CERZMDRAFT_95517 [Cercospora zeae-maydis SCOH1-5]|uniref:Uncharacterized protein n=1 Tax=Cercospora zeae-maydis SCOH1-5 TaxID=717836 RepID=A0A6A6FLK9_9PEZI|nr:hypothetical protein CERZMDRAFT_95517 [Cercospora zeae-maydis SCOH1-5]
MRFSTVTTIALVGSAYAAPAVDITRREAEAGLSQWISNTARKWFMGFEKRDAERLMARIGPEIAIDEDFVPFYTGYKGNAQEKRDLANMLARDPEAGLGDWISNAARKWYMGFEKRDVDGLEARDPEAFIGGIAAMWPMIYRAVTGSEKRDVDGLEARDPEAFIGGIAAMWPMIYRAVTGSEKRDVDGLEARDPEAFIGGIAAMWPMIYRAVTGSEKRDVHELMARDPEAFIGGIAAMWPMIYRAVTGSE